MLTPYVTFMFLMVNAGAANAQQADCPTATPNTAGTTPGHGTQQSQIEAPAVDDLVSRDEGLSNSNHSLVCPPETIHSTRENVHSDDLIWNKAGLCHAANYLTNRNLNNAGLTGVHDGCPWRSGKHHYDPRGIIALHQEIEQFYEYVTPSECERQLRLRLVEQITSIIQQLWPEVEVKMFGSFSTGLYLSTSDVDLVLISVTDQTPFYTLKNSLLDAKFCRSDQILVLENATVPILKLTEKHFQVEFDISFSKGRDELALKSTKVVNYFRDRFPKLAKLVVVLKQFLILRGLNKSDTGGIASYSTVLMVVSFLQMRQRQTKQEHDQDLGVLLIEFFELYGVKFNYINAAIRVKGDGSYFSKEEVENPINNTETRSILFIEDPNVPGRNIAQRSIRARQAKEAFGQAYRVLQRAVNETNKITGDSCLGSILGRIVRVNIANRKS